MMMNKRGNTSGITVTELLVVVIIMGLVVGFAVPNFERSRDRAAERSAALQLAMVRNAMRVYFAKEGITRIPNTGVNPDYDAQRINKLLSINVIEPPNLTFQCYDTNGGSLNNCRFVHSGGWRVEFHDTGGGVIIGSNIHCDIAGGGTPCPFCADEGGGGCPY